MTRENLTGDLDQENALEIRSVAPVNERTQLVGFVATFDPQAV